MSFKSITHEGNSVHTGEVVGSIPTAPTSASWNGTARKSPMLAPTGTAGSHFVPRLAHAALKRCPQLLRRFSISRVTRRASNVAG